VADQLLTQRFRTTGGAVSYEISEAIYNTREVNAVSPGAEYPRDTPGTGTAALAAVSKWGQAVRVTDEQIKRANPPGDVIDRALRKLLNTIIRKVDRVTIAAIASAVTQTSAATAAWGTSSATMLLDLETAIAEVEDLDQGYKLDTALMSTTKYAQLVSDDKIATLRRREATDNPVYSGTIEVIAGLKVIKTSTGNLPSDDVWLLDSQQLGGMADETELDPGYSVAEMGVQVQTKRISEVDAFDLWGRRITVPVVQEPSAAIRITATAGS
jgi:hypothetical protein